MPFHFKKKQKTFYVDTLIRTLQMKMLRLTDFKYRVQGHKDCSEAEHILEVIPGLQLELELKLLTTILLSFFTLHYKA